MQGDTAGIYDGRSGGKKMGVTVRTLQYYDKEGLFSPLAESESGRGLYTDKALITLHQILSFIMFPADLLPDVLQAVGRIFPAYWGYRLMLDPGFRFQNAWYPILIFVLPVVLCGMFLRRKGVR